MTVFWFTKTAICLPLAILAFLEREIYFREKDFIFGEKQGNKNKTEKEKKNSFTKILEMFSSEIRERIDRNRWN